MAKGLAHKQIVEDSSLCDVASADYLLMFRKKGENQEPIQHPIGLTEYAGEREMPSDLLKYRGWMIEVDGQKKKNTMWNVRANLYHGMTSLNYSLKLND